MRQIPRLFVAEELTGGRRLALPPAATHQLATVLRLEPGGELRLFDDRTGEWAARITAVGRRAVEVEVGAWLRPREAPPDLWLCAAPLRPERFAWLAEKATELGVARIVPVLTARTQFHRQNLERLRARMVEAAEQCGRTALPELAAPVPLAELLAGWPERRALLFADEEGGAPLRSVLAPPPAALLVGPEGGFAAAERALLLAHPAVRRVSLGPRLLRAETAAVAGVALWQATSGDGS
ncbi:MAG: 16S rRNA (uracil(1498)-N(3))-methyltransferase [Sphingomonadaceae bacterium]|uniref:16S rRNA (uracil(1498)-N(3))-methyltransferase n=1 Tax=Thermaurantiacus sp. TaxID=2820283 RepID=UPI00298EFFBF|nr:16S rRNA (uracil(1498)-N(3))-methyltransferase [Thermaurantiacus sp.]MCS6986736.1 16S rRNA (uracil(1498)-N(3))-methyltransferase [Sphingomonadaceae bacterium]MDW8414001.1 16S rRNA (uracil(1498)-N(3))-methyltransferase [Thermaurantiacus sp.]